MATVIKPSRSDEVVDPEEQLRITHEIKTRFESMAPKRPIKPNRSEPDPDGNLAHQTHSDPIPELQKFLSFKSDHNQVDLRTATGGELVVQEEFVETQYYKQLVSIDKQHHTTGTGFIRAVKEDTENGENYELPRLYENGEKKVGAFSGYKSNPATNDWIPNVDQIEYVSTKPSRSG